MSDQRRVYYRFPLDESMEDPYLLDRLIRQLNYSVQMMNLESTKAGSVINPESIEFRLSRPHELGGPTAVILTAVADWLKAGR